MDRKGSFKKDTKAIAAEHQFGNELYNAIKANGFRPNDFEQGHLTSFQEVIWGKTPEERKKAADDTFYFTNCVPQHERVNSGLWRSLEQYVLKTQTIHHGLKSKRYYRPPAGRQRPLLHRKNKRAAGKNPLRILESGVLSQSKRTECSRIYDEPYKTAAAGRHHHL